MVVVQSCELEFLTSPEVILHPLAEQYLQLSYHYEIFLVSFPGDKSYQTLKSGFDEVFSELNSLMSNPTIIVNGEEYSLQFFSGSDYKVRPEKLMHNFKFSYCYI